MSKFNSDLHLRAVIRSYNRENVLNEDKESPKHSIQKGGSDNSEPNGGFPPIILCDKKIYATEEKEKNREFVTNKKAISIKDIMKKRRDNDVPFIEILN
jgi:hypothetical protein